VSEQSAHVDSASIALSVRGVRFTYPARRRQPARVALHGVDLAIAQGQAVAMLGPNGSGKSTLMKIIAGLLVPEAGEVELFGSRELNDIRRSLGVVFQTEGLDRHMTVAENLRDQASLYGIASGEAKAIISTELKKAGLEDRRGSLVKTLSKGLARRVDLCRAVLHKPRLLMLDEPTVGLDPMARENFLGMLETRRNEDGLTILMSTHLVDEADRCDRVLLLHEGRIIADDTPGALRNQLGRRRIMVMDTAWRPAVADRWERTSAGWAMSVDEDVEHAQRVAGELIEAGVTYTIAPPTLADVFESLTGASLESGDGRNESDTRAKPRPRRRAG
jgi:ABC-2 type transport system ATP-binding protein